MASQKLNDWLQLAAALGVIIGLVLVAVELRQESNLTRAEMGFEAFGAIEDMYRSTQNATTAKAVAKSCESPLEMTTSEHTIVQGFYNEAIISVLGREFYMQERGLFEDDLRKVAGWATDYIFVCEYGRSWYQLNRETMEPAWLDLLDEAFATPRMNYLESLDVLERQIASELEKHGSKTGDEP